MKKRLVIISALVLSYSTLGFAADKPTEAPPIVSVNGVAITTPELQHFMSRLQQAVPPQQALQEIINVELLVQAAKDKGMMKNESLNLEIKRVISGTIASHFLQQQLVEMNITEADVKARYEKEYLNSDSDKEYNANHILLKTEDEAKDIIKQLDKGAEFTELAKKHSTGHSGVTGGALGWFKSESMVPPFSKATMLLSPKQHSKTPVKTQFGWHVIKLNEARKSEPPAFETVSKKLSSAIAAENISKLMDELHKSASIVFPDKK